MMQQKKDSFIEQPLSSFAARLKYARERVLRLPRRHFEEKYSFSAATLKAWENGQIQPTRNSIDRCIEIYKREGLFLDEHWLLTGEGKPPRDSLQLMQLFSNPTEIEDGEGLDEELCILKDVESFKRNNVNSVTLMVSNDDMHPYYKSGDYVGGKLKNGDKLSLFMNKDCIVYLKNGECFFRRVIAGERGKINLSCLNPLCSSNDPVLYDVIIDKAAPVIFHRWKDIS